jgi:hypothetical protein
MAGCTAGDLLHAHVVVDDVLAAHAPAIGRDLPGYRHHVYRVLNLARAFAPPGDDVVEKLATAAVFHDLGIWTDHTFDYLPPSIARAGDWLQAAGRASWSGEVAAMIGDHHKITASRHPREWLVEPFRRADWVDVTLGLRRFGLDGQWIRAIRHAWPDAGFHRRLVELSLVRFARHPLSPLPMVRF